MDFGFTEEQRLLRDSVRKLLQKHATLEYVRKHDRERTYPEELFEAWAEAGLMSLPFPEEYGGAGGSLMDMVVVAEEIARVSADLVMAYTGGIFCGLNLVRKASEEQKRYWLPKFVAGEIKFSISMSEPDAGSDIGAMRTTAVKDGNEWVIDGQKIWASTAGAKNNVICLYVKTDPKAHYRQGMSLFLVDNDTPGLTLRKLDMLGRRATGTYELTFDKVRRAAGPIGRRRKQRLGLRDVRLAGRTCHLVCRQCRRGTGSHRSRRAICQGSEAIRPPDRHQPGDRAHARRYADRGGGRADINVACSMDGLDRSGRAARNHDGKAFHLGNLCESR